MSATTTGYLKHMVDGFYDSLIILQEQIDSVSDDELETIYALGYNYFTYGKYEEAKDIFKVLTDIAPYANHYWRALGAVNQQLKNYPEAVAAYEMAIANEESDIISHIYNGETHILAGDVEAGTQILEQALKIGAENSLMQSDPWMTRAKMLLRIHKVQK